VSTADNTSEGSGHNPCEKGLRVLGIESSCDDTAAALWDGCKIRANFSATQEIHRRYGGVVPELASRDHEKHIVPLVQAALQSGLGEGLPGEPQGDLQAGHGEGLPGEPRTGEPSGLGQATPAKLKPDAIAFTRGPGLLGSLLVGASFAKALAWAWDIPLIGVHHMKAHVLAHFIEPPFPPFPFLCLTVSGGHTQLVRVNSPLDMQILGQTLDDAAGEAFDKCGKLLGLDYPAGPHIDRLAATGDGQRFVFSRARIPGLDFSFSGLKTSVLYFLREQEALNPGFTQAEQADLAASVQQAIIAMLLEKLQEAARQENLVHIALAGGVSANSGLRSALKELAAKKGWTTYLPAFAYCTDNAAMIARAGAFALEAGLSDSLDVSVEARLPW
jgi:N6-L-threonylcarbamoyladenine synthase